MRRRLEWPRQRRRSCPTPRGGSWWPRPHHPAALYFLGFPPLGLFGQITTYTFVIQVCNFSLICGPSARFAPASCPASRALGVGQRDSGRNSLIAKGLFCPRPSE